MFQHDPKARLYKQLCKRYSVKKFTEYQWRINGIIDIYPVNEKYHNIKTQERGSYASLDLIDFIDHNIY